MKIIDDVFPTQFQEYLEKFFTSDNLPWYMDELTADHSNASLDKYTEDSFHFCHVFIKNEQINSQHWANIQAIIQWLILKENISIKSVLRAKANLTFTNKNYNYKNHLPAHIDTPPNTVALTAIYYINDSDGDTIFFKNQENPNDELEEISRVSPKKGRLVLFDCNTLHAGCLPEKTTRRYVLNLNFATS